MPITKEIVVDQITVTENGIVLYREATKIVEDGVMLTQTYHRSSLTPGQDLTGVPANVVAICNVAWTSEVVAAYQAQMAAVAGAAAADAAAAAAPAPAPAPAEG